MHLLLNIFPQISLKKNPVGEDTVSQPWVLFMVALRQGRVVVPLGRHDRKAVPHGGSPASGGHRRVDGRYWMGDGTFGLYGT